NFMSFDIFLNAFSNGATASFNIEVLKAAFGPDARFEDDFSRVRFPDGSGGDIYGADEPEISNLMFNHCGGDAFFEAMLELARRTNGLIFWPSEPATAISPNEDALAHAQPEFLEAFDDVKIARTTEDLRAAIEQT
ncbi:MAG TPA: hypothetical protein VL899_00555, partial [Alphaproteobacteria bacterium]|nr:hypothetical protein [Alphaproteobacteria bacterium]